jgi:hypothetical protein
MSKIELEEDDLDIKVPIIEAQFKGLVQFRRLTIIVFKPLCYLAIAAGLLSLFAALSLGAMGGAKGSLAILVSGATLLAMGGIHLVVANASIDAVTAIFEVVSRLRSLDQGR